MAVVFFRAQVCGTNKAVHARRTELRWAIAILSNCVVVASEPVASRADGGVTRCSAERALVQARRLLEQFERRWGFSRDCTLGAAIRVCVYARACVCVCVR
jgi:hypothetical protein